MSKIVTITVFVAIWMAGVNLLVSSLAYSIEKIQSFPPNRQQPQVAFVKTRPSPVVDKQIGPLNPGH